ncbi:MAG: hypothetical protein R3E60_00810 [Alphaproteobacteria bacterium]
MIIDGPKKFYAYFRARSNSENHAGDLTCKGRAALGKESESDNLVQSAWKEDLRANFIG